MPPALVFGIVPRNLGMFAERGRSGVAPICICLCDGLGVDISASECGNDVF